ncbi:cyanamide hydratase [Aspergillus homomorphus CBS 101889]|uniref:Cyanamide hydratase n=1 Tax=Aspergillus homomorphus (strain CBS 101889) TaxID=1450537 RepID=A0A395IBY9_ASPHC|nr:cyanamide hydratase [Aspergillus homomorphus CBS 101889]RAL16608.1 cyanamide hydratase [Aspergillus homomorphus CBS 101889]
MAGLPCLPTLVLFSRTNPLSNGVVAIELDEIEFPYNDSVVAKTLEYARTVLYPETLNHSMRVYYYQQFPAQAASLNPATWALTCLLHDLGTGEENLTATRMSFDIYGGIKALYVLEDFGATTDQAEAAAEAIIRHEDMGVDGAITYFGQLGFKKLVHDTTRRLINEAHPRLQMEELVKPWCHSTHLVDFDRLIEANTLMKQW